jgi:peptidoglycan/xylan/chitin deacetylase (PgdA/CDA1 family)
VVPPLFVVSLDFELLWGVRDVMTLEQYRENLVGERVAVEALLELFTRRGISGTWATVGALFCRTKKEFLAAMPERRPSYVERALSPYDALHELGDDERSDPFHYAPSLVEKIARTPGQELATHTFSHFYCLEPGQTEAEFRADLDAARRVGASFGDVTKSIVFPRNQYNERYRSALKAAGVVAYRSNGPHWAYRPSVSREPRWKRAARLVDAYAPLSGARATRVRPSADGLVDVPASAFLRPYSPGLRRLDGARFRRLSRAMTEAARRGETFHLWWHPHNFGTNLRENMAFLSRLLDHFDALRRREGMESVTMNRAATMAV